MYERSPIDFSKEANLVLIGGGTYAGTARPLLEMGVDLSGKEKPNVLVLPTPKSRQADYDVFVPKVTKMYGESIGTNVSMLHEYGSMPSFAELEDSFNTADVLYISGGNTKYALETWRKHGVDSLLTDAMRRGKIMTGISAGTLTWFNRSQSDSQSYEVEKGEPWSYQEVTGLNQIKVNTGVHYNSTDTPDGRIRSEHFKDLLADWSAESGTTEIGLGIDNEASFVSTGGLIRVVRSREGVNLHVVRANADGYRHDTVLNAPSVTISKENTSADQLPNNGITWDEFYDQLKK